MRLLLSILLIIFLCVRPEPIIADEKRAFIFAGYKSSTSKELYQQIGKEFRELGIQPEFVEIDWSTGSILSFIEQGRKVVSTKKGDVNYFYGFSIGGMIALSLATEVPSKSVLVSSLAPFFREDIESLKWYSPHKLYNWFLFGTAGSVSKETVVSGINTSKVSVLLLVGEREHKNMIELSSELAKNLANGEYLVMDDIGHGLSKPGHIKYVVEGINQLLNNDAN